MKTVQLPVNSQDKEAGFHDYSEAFLIHFFSLFPFDLPKNIRKSKVF